MNKTLLIAVFWIALIAFFTWDWVYSAPVNMRQRPPVIAVLSGQPPTGAHCAATF